MPTALFEQLTAIEAKAAGISAAAEKAKTLAVINAKKHGEELLVKARQTAKEEAATLIEEARRAGLAEKSELENETGRQIEALRRQTTPKIEAAKKLCQ